jgi:hypothetical protein
VAKPAPESLDFYITTLKTMLLTSTDLDLLTKQLTRLADEIETRMAPPTDTLVKFQLAKAWLAQLEARNLMDAASSAQWTLEQ